MIRELSITNFTPSEDDTIWDVRDEKAYKEGHIEYAKNHPLDTLTNDLLNQTDGTVYVLCGGGTRAGKSATLLDSFDDSRDIVILQGGTRGAKSAGMTIVSE
ncbi:MULTISPECIES: rhodanese-like domain-containing protein [unclassified Moraxella]|uniref:rhodanese-like domain-containing protein n=1 Tax=unclassified Moraxella TaxID=2685852 RepID=UPI003AF7D3E2